MVRVYIGTYVARYRYTFIDLYSASEANSSLAVPERLISNLLTLWDQRKYYTKKGIGRKTVIAIYNGASYGI